MTESGIDLKEIFAAIEAARTSEERESLRLWKQDQARFDETREEIVAEFAVLGSRPAGSGERSPVSRLAALRPGYRPPGSPASSRPSSGVETYVVRSWRRPVGIRIEERTRNDGKHPREVLSFVGAVTGHESYELDEDFVSDLRGFVEAGADPGFGICSGTAGRYERCVVDAAEVLAYLERYRPGLFTASPTP